MSGRESKLTAAARKALEALSDEQDPLHRLDLVRQAREALDELEHNHIEAARADGRTWAQIGKLYGLTKQGAQQRFRRNGEVSE